MIKEFTKNELTLKRSDVYFTLFECIDAIRNKQRVVTPWILDEGKPQNPHKIIARDYLDNENIKKFNFHWDIITGNLVFKY